MAESAAQVTVGVREAAAIAGVSTKQVRAWIKEGAVRADLVKGRYGEAYQIEAASLPQQSGSVKQGYTRSGHWQESSAARLETGLAESLLRMLQETQHRLEGAATRAAQLEGAQERVLSLAADAESLRDKNTRLTVEAAETKARAEILHSEVKRLRVHRLLLLAAVLIVVAGLAIWKGLTGGI